MHGRDMLQMQTRPSTRRVQSCIRYLFSGVSLISYNMTVRQVVAMLLSVIRYNMTVRHVVAMLLNVIRIHNEYMIQFES